MKRFSIIKSVDINKLDRQIEEYECTTGEVPYLFMANATGDAIMKELCNDSVMYPADIEKVRALLSCDCAMLGTYKGTKIYQNEDLPFGEVEIR